jgi:EmrB/QacA subfamily drug resistance transporter
VPLYGKLSDIYGRKVLFQTAVVAFVIGSLLSGVSQSMLQLVLFRGVQGLGAGGLMAMAQAIIGDVVSPRERGRYQGYFGGVFAIASVAGPLLGGVFVDHLTWRWVFYINIPLGILALIVTSLVLRVPYKRLEHSIDYAGTALMVGGVSCLLLVTTWGGNEYAWSSPMILGLAIAGAVLVVAFVLQESRAEEPLLPLRLFRDRIFSASSAVGFVVGLAMFGAVAFLPVYFQVVRGVSATSSGLRLTPMMIGVVSTSIIAGRLITARGRYRVYPIIGTAIMTAALYLLSTIDTSTSILLVSLYMLLLGTGLGLVMQVIVLAVQNSAEYRDLGTATAGVNFFRSMGGAFGVAIFGSILTNRLNYHLPRLIPADQLNGLSAGALTAGPQQLAGLPPAVHAGVIESFSLSLHTVFLATIPIGLAAFLLAWLIDEIPLRESIHSETAPEPMPTTYAETLLDTSATPNPAIGGGGS